MDFLLSIIGNPVFIQVALAILGAVVGKAKEDSEARKRFQEFVEALYKEGAIPAKLREKYNKQVKDNADAAEQQYLRENPPPRP